jgi:PAS domain S-box-containing protein
MLMLIQALVQSPQLRRKQATALMIASVAPFGGNFVYLIGLSPLPHLDPTPFCFMVTCLACGWALLNFRLVGIVPEAYNAVIQGMDDIVLVLDAGSRIVDLNPAAQKLFELTCEKSVGQPVEEALAGWPALLECYREGTETRTQIALGEDKVPRQFHLSIMPLHSNDGIEVGCLILLREITDRARTERALRESEERYRMLVEQARDIICTIDMKSGIITGANDFAAKMLGHDMDEVVNRMSFLELVHPEDYESVIIRMQELAVEKTRAPNFPLRLVKADGSVMHVEVNASVVYDPEGAPDTFFGVLRDVTDRKHAEEALKESEERYRILVDHSLTGVCLLQDMKCEFANNRLLAISGYSSEEIVGMPIDRLVHPDDIAKVQDIIARRFSGKVPMTQHQFRAIRKDGENLWIETFGAPIEYMGKPALLINVVDITERRRAEEALRLTQFTVDHAPDPVYWMGPDARFVYVNEAACQKLGYSQEELLSMTVHDIDPDFTAEVWPDHWRELQQKRTRIIESHHKTKDDRIFPVEITLNLLEFMGKEYNCAVAHDISNREEAALQIQQSEERYRALFKESKDCVFITSPDGAFLDINPAGVELFGYSSKEELLDADPKSDLYVKPEDRDTFQAIMGWQGFVKDYELLLKTKDGRPLNILVTASVYVDDKNETNAYRGIMRDITERKQLEHQLIQSQKMEGIGTLAGGIAHDFNNILGGILGYASFMKTKMDENHEFFRYVDTIESGATRAAELTSQLLAFARGGKYETQPINLNTIVAETLKLVGRTFDKAIEISANLTPELPAVEADAGQMQQVMMNLCVNASDAMPAGGLLVIETGVEQMTEVHVAKGSNANSRPYVVLLVADSGIGMAPETLQRIFEPFYTTKAEGKGTGLGLSMVYGVVKNHGGFIDVRSEPGDGSSFKVYIPASEEIATLQQFQEEAPQGGNELILVVDDEEPICSLAKEILEDHGYRVLLAADGAEAIAIFREYNGEIGLVILDMVMPKMGGRETFMKMREINPEVRALLSTGYSREGKAREIVESGVLGFVQKPYGVHSLLAAVRNVLDRETSV